MRHVINSCEVNFLQSGLNFDESLLGEPYSLKHTNAIYKWNDIEEILVMRGQKRRTKVFTMLLSYSI